MNRKYFLLLLLFAFFIGCSEIPDDNNNYNNEYSAFKIDVLPDSINIATGDSLQLTVQVLNRDGILIEDYDIEWFIEDTTIVRMDTNLVLVGTKVGHTYLRASIDTLYDEIDITVYDRSLRGRVKLGNQTDHGGIMVGWLPLGEEYKYGGHNLDYVLTDSMGYYILPNLEDGEWVFTAEYPYYDRGRDTVKVVDGKPDRLIKDFFLTQLLSFEVILGKTEYTVDDTVWIKFKATNLTDSTLQFVSRSYRIWSGGVAIAKDTEPLMIELENGGRYGFIFQFTGQPAFDNRIFLPHQTIVEDASDAVSDYEKMYIELPWLYETGNLKIGETYEIYAGYVADWTYSWNYFRRVSLWEESRHGTMNFSLYKKLDPVLITIRQ